MNKKTQFGALNTETGEFSNGYLEKGEMKFKKIPWYKKLFAKEPTETEFIGIVEGNTRFIWCDQNRAVNVPIYKKYNPYTGQIKSLYGDVKNHGRIFFNIQVFEKFGKFIEIER